MALEAVGGYGYGAYAAQSSPTRVTRVPAPRPEHGAHSTHGAQAAEAAGLEPIISWRAHARGLHTLDELKSAVLRQRRTWWQGRTFHCPLCDVDFVDATPAAEHVVQLQHPVLRMD